MAATRAAASASPRASAPVVRGAGVRRLGLRHTAPRARLPGPNASISASASGAIAEEDRDRESRPPPLLAAFRRGAARLRPGRAGGAVRATRSAIARRARRTVGPIRAVAHARAALVAAFIARFTALPPRRL